MKRTVHHKIRPTVSKNYGSYNLREIGVIPMAGSEVNRDLVEKWSEKFHPSKYFIGHAVERVYTPDSKGSKSDYLTLDEQLKLPIDLLKKYNTLRYFTTLDVDNDDWRKNNEVFIKESEEDFLMKSKRLPTELSFDSYVTWYIHSKDIFCKEWMKENAEYLKEMDIIVQEWNNEFLSAVKGGDLSGVKKGFKRNLAMSGNLSGENSEALSISIKNKDFTMSKYLLSKGFKSNEDLISLADPETPLHELLQTYFENDNKRTVKKAAAEEKKRKIYGM